MPRGSHALSFALDEDDLRCNIAPDRRASSLSSTRHVQRFLLLFRWIFDDNTLDTNECSLFGGSMQRNIGTGNGSIVLFNLCDCRRSGRDVPLGRFRDELRLSRIETVLNQEKQSVKPDHRESRSP